MKRTIKAGTRGSALALAQSNEVISLLASLNPDVTFDVSVIRTTGDSDRSTSLERLGGVGVFTRKIESELLSGNIDLAVHSAKDLPAIMTEGLTVGAVPTRAPGEDVWISSGGYSLSETKPGAVVGTGAPRRYAQLLYFRPDLKIMDIRGNVETRLKKMVAGECDALILARAGLSRLGLEQAITETLSSDKLLPAPGQGALIVQCRNDDTISRQLVDAINDPISFRCVNIERLLLQILNAGCSAAVGGWARYEKDHIRLNAVVLDKDGRKRLFASDEIHPERPDKELAEKVGESLISQGATSLIESEKHE